MSSGDMGREVVAGRYRLDDRLGRGGMGQVWRARDDLLGREVAVKEVTLPPGTPDAERDVLRARVLREARAAARVQHGGVVAVYDVVPEEGRTFIVMELVAGRSLAEIVEADGPVPPERAANLGLQVLSALEAAHAQGIVHRDVKPSNIMVLGDGRAKLADFGVASVRDEASLTMSGQVFGSPHYMAPEQALGEPSGPPADLWALGATLYFAVEGHPPFQREHPLATVNAVVADDPSPPARAGPLEPAIRSMLAKDPASRPSIGRARSLLGAVASVPRPAPADDDAITAELFPEAPPRPEPTRPEPTRPEPPTPTGPGPRRGTWAVAAAVVLLVGLAGLAVWLLPSAREPDPGGSADRSPAPAADPVPEDWVRYRDDEVGYRLAHPPGWEVVDQEGNLTDFIDPETGAYLRVDWTDDPGPDPVAAWESLAEDFAADHDGYREIRIEPATYQGFEAGVWEFTFVEDGTRLRGLDLGFVTGDHGFALFFRSDAESWQDFRDERAAFQASFRPPD
jgi:eukaryotic-like serine/threonine-protein kinase